MQRIRSLCDEEQFDLVNIEIQSTSDVLPALARYYKEFSAVLMLDDPILLDIDVLSSVSNFLSSKGIAFFALDCSMVQAGALASFGTNFAALGRDLVKMVSHDRGTHKYQPTQIVNPSEPDLCVNLTTAGKMAESAQFLSRAVHYAGEKEIALRIFGK